MNGGIVVTEIIEEHRRDLESHAERDLPTAELAEMLLDIAESE